MKKETNENSDFLAWGLVFGAISAGAGLFNAYDEAVSNRQVRAKLKEIKDYLIGLDVKLSRIVAQNQEILKKLDALPLIIRQIIGSEISAALLDQHHSKLDNITDNLLSLNNWRRYRLNKPGWDVMSESLTYIVDNENRLSKLFHLLNGFELALHTTRGRAKPFVKLKVETKIAGLSEMVDEIRDSVELKLEILKRNLNNTKYIQSHNLEGLEDFSLLSYTKKPNRTTTQSYSVRTCRSVGNCRERQVCRDSPRSRQVPDDSFHNTRDNHDKQIKSQRKNIKKELEQLVAANAMLQRFRNYESGLNARGLVNDEEGTLLIFPNFEWFDESFQEPVNIPLEIADAETLRTATEEFLDGFEEVSDTSYPKVLPSEDTKFFTPLISCDP